MKPCGRNTIKRFDRAWAMTLIERVRRLLEEEYALEGKARLFQLLHVFLSGDRAVVSYTEAAVNMSRNAERRSTQRGRGK